MTAPNATSWIELGDFTGPEGPQGPQGLVGEQGPIGSQGEQGVPGAEGPQGVQGAEGVGFDPAPQVATVDDLPAGDPPGTTRLVMGPGAPSAAGPAGHIYAKEENGTWTDMGQSAYVGPQGPTGAQGEQGPTGAQGEQGIPGPDGEDGAAGTQGVQGPSGAPGPAGTDALTPIAYPAAGPVPDASQYRVGQIAIGGDGKLLRAV